MSRLFLAERRIGLSVSDSPDLAQLGLGPEHVEDALVQPAGRTAPIWAYLMRQGASLSWST